MICYRRKQFSYNMPSNLYLLYLFMNLLKIQNVDGLQFLFGWFFVLKKFSISGFYVNLKFSSKSQNKSKEKNIEKEKQI